MSICDYHYHPLRYHGNGFLVAKATQGETCHGLGKVKGVTTPNTRLHQMNTRRSPTDEHRPTVTKIYSSTHIYQRIKPKINAYKWLFFSAISIVPKSLWEGGASDPCFTQLSPPQRELTHERPHEFHDEATVSILDRIVKPDR